MISIMPRLSSQLALLFSFQPLQRLQRWLLNVERCLLDTFFYVYLYISLYKCIQVYTVYSTERKSVYMYTIYNSVFLFSWLCILSDGICNLLCVCDPPFFARSTTTQLSCFINQSPSLYRTCRYARNKETTHFTFSFFIFFFFPSSLFL